MLEWVAMPSSRGSSQPSDGTKVSRIAHGIFTSCATEEAQEYWNGSLSPLKLIFLTQESNQGLLHCRGLLYQLSYQRIPSSKAKHKRSKSGWWLNSWKSPPLSQHSCNNPPTYSPMKLPSPIKTDNPIPWGLSPSEMAHILSIEGISP